MQVAIFSLFLLTMSVLPYLNAVALGDQACRAACHDEFCVDNDPPNGIARSENRNK